MKPFTFIETGGSVVLVIEGREYGPLDMLQGLPAAEHARRAILLGRLDEETHGRAARFLLDGVAQIHRETDLGEEVES